MLQKQELVIMPCHEVNIKRVMNLHPADGDSLDAITNDVVGIAPPGIVEWSPGSHALI